MKSYQFKNVIYSPDEANKLTVDGKPVQISGIPVLLLEYFIKNAKVIKKRQDIIDAVWGPGIHSFTAFQGSLHKLQKCLPEDCKISTVRGHGYVLDEKITVYTLRYTAIENKLKNSSRFRNSLYAIIGTLLLGIILTAGYFFTKLYFDINPPTRYKFGNTKALFTRDYVIGTPQLSPDRRFLAHRLSENILVDDHLGLLDRKLGDTRPIVPMGFLDGYKWDLNGDRIVYQHTQTGQCEVRLLTFHNQQKTDFSVKKLLDCPNNSGHISFSWYSNIEFYANFVSEGATPTPNNLPSHHLYAYNISTKKLKLVTKANYQGGFGFYSLEYDPSTGRLHFLQTNHFKTTDFYYFDGDQIIKTDTIDQYVPFFTVSNNTLIYKNKNQNFVINRPADNLTNPQEFLHPQLVSINQPHLMGKQLVYIAGNTYGIGLHQLANGQISAIKTKSFNPVVLANYQQQMVFAAKQTGIKQVYLLTDNHGIQQISNMQTHEDIKHIEVADNVFILSYANRVDIYHLKDMRLHLVNSLANYNLGVIHPSGKTLLLRYNNTDNNSHDTPVIIEQHLSDFTPTGRQVTGARFAFYHHDDIIYHNKDKELFRLESGSHSVIASDVEISLYEHTDINGDDFYYIARKKPNRPATKIDLTTGKKSPIPLGNLMPIKIQMINDKLLISATIAKQPRLVTGEVIAY